MSYKADLVGQIEEVSKLERKRQKGLKELVELLSLKADAELLYGRTMDRLSSLRTHAYSPESSLYKAVQAVREDCGDKWKEAKKYYEEVHNDVIAPLKKLLREQNSQHKSLEAKWRAHHDAFREKKAQVEATGAEYFRAFEEFDKNMEAYEKMAPSFPEEKRIRVIQRINQHLVACKETEKSYKSQIYVAKEARVEFTAAIGELLEVYQKMEEERLDKIKVALLAFFAKENESHATKNSNTAIRTSAVELISKENEIKAIVEKCKAKQSQLQDVSFARANTKYENVFKKFDTHYARGSPPLKFDIEVARLSTSGGIEDDLNEKDLAMLNAIRKALASCWEGREITQSEKDAFKEIVKTKRGRKFFGEALNQYRKNSLFSMKKKAYGLVSELLYIVMDQVEKDNDIETALNIMILSQTFYLDQTAEEGKNEKVFLQWGIQKHPFWHYKGLWEKAIDIAVKEELASPPIPEETKAEKEMRISNIIFGKLGAFAHNMLHFDIAKEEVEGVILAHAKQKNLPEHYIVALQQTINDTAKNVLETAPPQKDLFLWIKDLQSNIEAREKSSKLELSEDVVEDKKKNIQEEEKVKESGEALQSLPEEKYETVLAESPELKKEP